MVDEEINIRWVFFCFVGLIIEWKLSVEKFLNIRIFFVGEEEKIEEYEILDDFFEEMLIDCVSGGDNFVKF